MLAMHQAIQRLKLHPQHLLLILLILQLLLQAQQLAQGLLQMISQLR